MENKVQFIETFSPKHRWIEQNGIRKGELIRFNNLWLIELNGKRISDNGYGSFSLAIAKKIVKERLIKQQVAANFN